MRKQHNKGFTLVEIIVSIALLGMIALFMLPMSIQSVQFSKWNNIKLTALNLAYTQVEWIKTLDFYGELGMNKASYSPMGIVNPDSYLDKGTSPMVIEGISYSILTDIYWKEATASTGDTVSNAMKVVDVIVTARDPITKTEKTFSSLGTLISFEGETIPPHPLKVKVVNGENINSVANNIIVVVENLMGTFVTQGETKNNGEVVFEGLDVSDYYIYPQVSNKMGRPASVTGTAPNENWSSKVRVEHSDYEKMLHVSPPGAIELPDYNADMMKAAKVTVSPIDPPDNLKGKLDLDTNLFSLESIDFWRQWSYSVSDVNYTSTEGWTDTYYLMEENDGGWFDPDYWDRWNGNFNSSTESLDIFFGLKGGTIKQTGSPKNYDLTVELEFTSDVKNISDTRIVLSEYYYGWYNYEIDESKITKVSGSHNKYTFTYDYNYNSGFELDDAYISVYNNSSNSVVNSFNVKMVPKTIRLQLKPQP